MASSIGIFFEINGLMSPFESNELMSAIFFWFSSNSLPVKAPQKTPTTDAPLSKVKLIGSFGICPAANPTTKYLPFQPIDLNAGQHLDQLVGKANI